MVHEDDSYSESPVTGCRAQLRLSLLSPLYKLTSPSMQSSLTSTIRKRKHVFSLSLYLPANLITLSIHFISVIHTNTPSISASQLPVYSSLSICISQFNLTHSDLLFHSFQSLHFLITVFVLTISNKPDLHGVVVICFLTLLPLFVPILIT